MLSADDIRKLRKSMNLNRDNFGKLIGVVGRTVEQYELNTAKPSKAVQMLLEKLKQERSK